MKTYQVFTNESFIDKFVWVVNKKTHNFVGLYLSDEDVLSIMLNKKLTFPHQPFYRKSDDILVFECDDMEDIYNYVLSKIFVLNL